MKMIVTDSRQQAFWGGVQAISPILVGVLPFATITGVTMVSVGIAPIPAIAMSLIVFAGASQLAVADLIAKTAPFLIIVLTALVINLRFLMYSASVAPHFSHLGHHWKWPLAYLLTDQGYAVSIIHFSNTPQSRYHHWYYFGSAVALWITWQIGTIVGVILGLQVPSKWSLDFAIPLTFLAVLIPSIKDSAALAAALSSGLIAVVGFNLPLSSGIIVAAFSGILIGFGVESMREKFSS